MPNTSSTDLEWEFPILESEFCDKLKAVSELKELYYFDSVVQLLACVSWYLSESALVFYRD